MDGLRLRLGLLLSLAGNLPDEETFILFIVKIIMYGVTRTLSSVWRASSSLRLPCAGTAWLPAVQVHLHAWRMQAACSEVACWSGFRGMSGIRAAGNSLNCSLVRFKATDPGGGGILVALQGLSKHTCNHIKLDTGCGSDTS